MVLKYTGIDLYYASEDGFIYRKMKLRPRHKGSSVNIRYGDNWFRLMKPIRSGKDRNYLRVYINNKGYQVHRLVLLAFKYVDGHAGLQSNHKDRNTFNNSVDNLEWCNNQENSIHRVSTERVKSYRELYKEYFAVFQAKQAEAEYYEPQKMGEWLFKYNKDMILEMLANTMLTKKEISVALGCSERAVRYWQEKEKIKQYDLSDVVKLLLGEDKDCTPKELSKRMQVRVTTVHGLLRKIKFEAAIR